MYVDPNPADPNPADLLIPPALYPTPCYWFDPTPASGLMPNNPIARAIVVAIIFPNDAWLSINTARQQGWNDVASNHELCHLTDDATQHSRHQGWNGGLTLILTLTLTLTQHSRHQGWNDGCSLNQTAEYETNMVNLVKDLRTEWKNPSMAVSIAVSGFDGFDGEEARDRFFWCWSQYALDLTLQHVSRASVLLPSVIASFGAESSNLPEKHAAVSDPTQG
jgi:hypothetical protein